MTFQPHIVQVMGGKEEGGLEKHVEELSHSLSVSTKVSVIAHPKYADRFAPPIDFHSIDLSKSRNNPIVLFKLAKLINRIAPKIVHAQGGKAAAMISRIRPIISAKVVATVHGLKKKQRFLRNFDHVIGVSRAVTQTIPNQNRSVIYNGIAQPKVSSANQPVGFHRTDKPLFIAVGRLVKVKGFDLLVEAWKGIDAELYIAGDGPERNALHAAIVKSSWLQNRIHLLGYRTDIADLINFADCTIISSHREGFSYVAAESLLLSTPILATNVPIANEVLTDNYLCETGSVAAIERLIHHHLNALRGETPSLQDQFAPSFDWAKSHLRLECMTENTLNLYHQLLEEKGSSPAHS